MTAMQNFAEATNYKCGLFTPAQQSPAHEASLDVGDGAGRVKFLGAALAGEYVVASPRAVGAVCLLYPLDMGAITRITYKTVYLQERRGAQVFLAAQGNGAGRIATTALDAVNHHV